MCGIIGAINGGTVINDLLAGLHRVEYRGYDSAGVAILQDAQILRRRAKGKLNQLENLLAKSPVDGAAGIAHTRWATHGRATIQNAHPHATENVAVVHNGIIENFAELRDQLSAKGHIFKSETDSEVIPHLITSFLEKGLSAEAAIHQAVRCLEGAYAIGILMKNDPEHLYAARKGSPLVVGSAEHGAYLASDQIALSEKAETFHFLEDGDIACLGRDRIEISDHFGKTVKRPDHSNTQTHTAHSKKNFSHYMLKEIHEQPQVIKETISKNNQELLKNPIDFKEMSRLTIIACGTSYYAAQVAKYWFEKYAKLSVDTDIASEFRYREPFMAPNGAALFISQSGETADTLAALKYAKENNQEIISIVNVAGSSIARESDLVYKTEAGVEIGVASTKAFTCQLALLSQMVIQAGLQRGTLSIKNVANLQKEVNEIPELIEVALKNTANYVNLAQKIKTAKSAIFLGRGSAYPLAMEGALKLKEISYIHSEGFAAGELKHGPIALVDEDIPIIAIAPSGPLTEKTISNIHEVQARGGQVICVGPTQSGNDLNIKMPECGEFTSPILYAIPMQMIAYYTAVAKGNDVDQPRNLAKSVTVE